MSSSQNIHDDVVVLEQSLLRVEETFVYRVPPMMTSSGHRAEDWNLSTPIATCSLHVKRVDSSLFIELFTNKPKPNAPQGATEKHLFAQCKVHLKINLKSKEATPKMEHWVEAVVDSSRYFVVRISDEGTGKEAHVGIGFRERNDALNLKMSLQDYENTMRKEAMLEEGNSGGDISASTTKDQTSISRDSSESNGTLGAEISSMGSAVSKLSLKEGEKIHVNIKGVKNKTRKKTQDGGGGKDAFLLKKPPASVQKDGTIEKLDDVEAVSKSHQPEAKIHDSVNEGSDDDEDDEWGDFESG